MSGAMAEVWRLPDCEWGPQLAIRQDNWIGWYKVLPEYGGTIKALPAGAVPLLLDGQWTNEVPACG